jgi:hypothetical protein
MTETVDFPAMDPSAPFDVEWDAGEPVLGGTADQAPSYYRSIGHRMLMADPNKGIFSINGKADVVRGAATPAFVQSTRRRTGRISCLKNSWSV